MNKDTVMLVNLSIGMWTGFRYDRSVSNATTDAYHAVKGSARVNKRLLPKATLADISSAYVTLRAKHRQHTLPWGDDDSRILPTAGYMRYMEEIRFAKDGFESAVQRFVKNYAQAVVDAEAWLKDMYRLDDYPPADTIADKFYVQLLVKPVPKASDFRLDIADGELERIKQTLEQHNKEVLDSAAFEIWARLYEATERVRDQLQDHNKRLMSANVDRLQTVIDLVPSLNFTDDRRFTPICKELEIQICSLDAKAARRDKKYREVSAKKFDKILTEIDKHMGSEP